MSFFTKNEPCNHLLETKLIENVSQVDRKEVELQWIIGTKKDDLCFT